MASKSLTFDIFGRDRTASKAIKGVGSSAQSIQGSFLKLGSVIAGAFAVEKIIQFGVTSIRAYADAQKQQAKLADAYERFPALADTNLAELKALSKAQEHKSRFDDDAIAAGEAQLAQYGLTGKQLKALTPLLVDYAARTGKDVVDASGDLGKALLGQGRALKAVGIRFKDTGSVVGNFDELMAGLRTQVGGFSEKDLTTAEGKLLNLENKFQDIEENIGQAFLPALSSVATWLDGEGMTAIQGFVTDGLVPGIAGLTSSVEWIMKYRDILGPAALAVGVLTAAMWLLNLAMDANPVGAVILGLTALIGVGTAVATNFNGVGSAVLDVWTNVQVAALGILRSVAGFFQGIVNGVIGAINSMLSAVNGIRAAVGMGPIGLLGKVDFTSTYSDAIAGVRAIQVGVRAVWAGGTSKNSGSPTAGGGGPGRINAGMMADGGIVRKRPGGVQKILGEGRWDEAVIPLSPQNLSQVGGGRNVTNIFNVYGDEGTSTTAVYQRLKSKLAVG